MDPSVWVTAILAIVILVTGIFLGYQFGYVRGYKKGKDDEHRLNKALNAKGPTRE